MGMYEYINDGDLDQVQKAVFSCSPLLNIAVTKDAESPLMWALHEGSGGHPAIALWLIDKGANLDLRNTDGWTALMFACRYDQPEVAMALINEGAKLDLRNTGEMTALMFACRCDQPEVAMAIIDKGANLDLRNTDGWTALMMACRYDQPEVAMALINAGAKLDLRNTGEMTALMMACRYDQPETAMALINAGANLNLPNENGWTALMYACRYDQPEVAMALINKGAKLDLQNNDGWTALMFACQQPCEPRQTVEGLLRCVKICYANGAVLTLKNKNGRDALSVAKYFKRRDAVAFLKFVTASKVARVLTRDLHEPRSVVVAFYEEGLLTMAGCSLLRDEDLEEMGVSSSVRRRAILQLLIPRAVEPSHQLAPRRTFLKWLIPCAAQPSKRLPSRTASHRVVSTLRRVSGAFQFDAFLTHDWGEGDANHAIVSSVNAMLRDANVVTWFDGQRLTGDIAQQITTGIETSRKVVVFITERYMHKLQSDDEDYCKEEFLAAARVRRTRNMIPVVMDPSMLDPSAWQGPLQLKLGGKLYIDFTTAAKRVENFSQLLERIGVPS